MDIDLQISEIIEELYSASKEAWLWSERIEMDDLDFQGFEPIKGCRMAAVDGSSGIAEPSGGLYMGLIRAGYVIYGEEREKKVISPIDVFRMGFDNSREIYESRYEDIFGEEAPTIVEAEPKYMLQRVRTLEEYRYISRALEELEDGDILLVDGALRGDLHTPEIAIKTLSERAQDRRVSVVGISKNSGLVVGVLPMVPMIDSEAERSGLPRWFVRIGGPGSTGKEDIYVVRYSPLGENAFRTDVISLEKVENVLGKIAGYCDDVAYLGYPYPLADIHNEVIIRRGTVEDISWKFKLGAMNKGMNYPENFHRKLDGGV